MNVKIEASWHRLLKDEFEKPYFKELSRKVREEYLTHQVYPLSANIFKAFEYCPFDDVQVVILGQDPYHGEGQAMGLSFSVPAGVKIPPSLKNIYKEILADTGSESITNGDLTPWTKNGVLLLNSTLTVRNGSPGSHQGFGWEQFTDAVIEKISTEKEHVVFLLWGKYAQDKGKTIDSSKHLVLQSPHPSPFSAHSGFFGSKHFSKTNKYLKSHGNSTIDW